MLTYERETWVDVPLADVWEFYSTPTGLTAVTPPWLHLRVEEVRGSDGSLNPDVLEVGSTVRVSMQPFGIGPRYRWTSRIVRRERTDGAAVFEDRMVGGPFRTWHHIHQFYSDGGRTLLRDTVEYELPFGVFGESMSSQVGVFFEPAFRHRHRRTKALLEGSE